MLVTGVSQLYGRLFDHHAVLQAEINHMKEYDKLTETCENLSKVSFALLNSSHKILLTKSKVKIARDLNFRWYLVLTFEELKSGCINMVDL